MNYETYDKAHNECSLRKLRHLLRQLGIRSIKSELEYSMVDLMKTMARDTYGRPDQIIVSPQTFQSMSDLLSKDKGKG